MSRDGNFQSGPLFFVVVVVKARTVSQWFWRAINCFSSYWLVSAVLSWSLVVLLTRSTFETGINRLVLYLDFRVASQSSQNDRIIYFWDDGEAGVHAKILFDICTISNGNLKWKKKKRLEFVLNDQVEVVADYFFFFFLLDTVECFYRTVDILEIHSKWLVVLYHFRRQLFLPQVFNRISWFRLPSLVLTS